MFTLTWRLTREKPLSGFISFSPQAAPLFKSEPEKFARRQIRDLPFTHVRVSIYARVSVSRSHESHALSFLIGLLLLPPARPLSPASPRPRAREITRWLLFVERRNGYDAEIRHTSRCCSSGRINVCVFARVVSTSRLTYEWCRGHRDARHVRESTWQDVNDHRYKQLSGGSSQGGDADLPADSRSPGHRRGVRVCGTFPHLPTGMELCR